MKKKSFWISLGIALVLATAITLLAVTVFAVGEKAAGDEGEKNVDWFYLSDFAPCENIVSGWEGANMLGVNGGVEANLPDLYLNTDDASSDEYKNNRLAFAKKYENGISLQANGLVVYDISHMNATRFTCLFGANAAHTNGSGSVGVRIYTDLNNEGEYLYSLNSEADAKALGVPQFPIGQYNKAVNIDIAIPDGATKLYIEATDGGNGNTADHATFAEPRLYADFVNLAELEYSDISTGWGSAVVDGSIEGDIILNTLYKGNYDNNSYVQRGITYDRGICVHAPSSLSYNIDGMGVTRFTSFCGISANSGNYNPTTVFKVFFDGKEVHSVTKTRNNANVGIGINIDLEVPAGVKVIKLTATATGSNDGNHTCWAYPRLFGENLGKVKDLKLEVPDGGIFVGEEKALQVYALNYKNKTELLPADSYRIVPKTENATVNGGKVKINEKGACSVTIEYLENGVVALSRDFDINVFDEESSFTVTSPDKKSVMTVFLSDGKLYYTAKLDGSVYVSVSQMGIKTSIINFDSSLEFVSATEPKEINETYKMASGKYSEYTNHCFERELTFKRSTSSIELKVIIRAYDDGVAFRYKIDAGKSFRIKDEATTMRVPVNTYAWYQPNTAGKYPNTHEQRFGEGYVTRYAFDITLPYMYKTADGVCVVVSEADLDGEYCGTVLSSASSDTLKFGFPLQQTNAQYAGGISTVGTDGDFESPWRAFVAGDEETLFASTMMENLSDPSVMEDLSWIEPGITSWSWMSGVNSGGNPFDYQGNESVIKKHIDHAASMGWQYYILDEGWMTRISNEMAQKKGLTGGRDWLPSGGWYTGFYDYTEEVIEYASSKNVGLIAWLHVSQFNDKSNDYQQMDDLFRELSEMGIKGIKADFFNSENQLTIQLYNKLYEKSVKYKLLLNLHGSNKPTGERRTYQNVINREAIYGEELNSTLAAQMVIQSYVRGLVGPTDLTPYTYPASRSDTTMGQQMAYSVIYESGMTCFASTINEFNALSEDIKQYYYAYPSVWHDSIFVSGSIGSDMTVARQSKDGRWYVGGITTDAMTETVSLDFLEDGTAYTAYIYTDGANRRSVGYEMRSVVKGDDISVSLAKNGGFAIKIVKTNATLTVNNDSALADVSVSVNGTAIGATMPASGTVFTVKVTAKGEEKPSHIIFNGSKKNLTNGEVELMASGGDDVISVVYESEKDANIVLDLESGGAVSFIYNGRYIEYTETLKVGESLTVRAFAARGYRVVGVYVNEKEITASENGDYTFEIEDESLTVKVKYERIG